MPNSTNVCRRNQQAMRLHGKNGWSIEVRGAEALPPGPYWALHFVDPQRLERPTSTEIQRARRRDGSWRRRR